MQKRRDVGFTYGCSSTRRIRHMVSNIFAYFLSPAKLLDASLLQFCPHSVSWRKDIELARAWRIIFPQVSVTLPEAASSRQPHGERRRGTGSQSLPFTSELHPHWQAWPYFHHFLGSLEVHHQMGLPARSRAGAAALEAHHQEFPVPAPAEVGAESPSAATHTRT